MQFEGTTEFMAERAAVWAFLVDPSRIGPCAPIPIERVDERHFRARARLGGGLFATAVTLDLELTDAIASERARLVGRGGGSGTTLTGSTSFTLRDGTMDGMTALDWTVELTLAGMLAGAAERIIAARGRGAIEQLLECIGRQIEGQPAGGDAR